MSEPFIISFREAFQCSLIAALILMSPDIRGKKGSERFFFSGIIAACVTGFLLGYIPYFGNTLLANETWTFLRYISETLIFYLSIVLVASRLRPSGYFFSLGLGILGFSIFFFESRASGFLTYDIGLMKENAVRAALMSIIGILSGFAPLFFLKRFLGKIDLKGALALPSLLLSIGSLKLVMGGVSEVEEKDLLISFQKGIMAFMDGLIKKIQSTLLIQDHSFINVPFSDLASFLSGDRIAMSLTVIFIMAPPIFILIHLVARPDPVVNDIQAGSQKRLKVALFRKDLIYDVTPVLIAFLLIFFQFHASNISLNPLYEPTPVTLRESEGRNFLSIPLSDRLGDFSDKKVRKYVYYYGNKQILFLAIMKPDGSIGLALDQCEICRPADWNKAAQGYAQKGDHLICKYCMTPIALPTINKPGGCNPIPIPFKMEDKNIVIMPDDLIKTFKYAETLDKKGTHL